MRGRLESICALIALNGGELIGYHRLQNTMYILDACRVGYGFEFLYHYYGPFSDDLHAGLESAAALDYIDADEHTTDSGHRYKVYTLTQRFSPHLAESETPDVREKRAEILKILDGKEHDSIVVELAATVMFLQKNGYETDEKAWAETKLRKSAKATPERVEIAKQLLRELSGMAAI